MPSASSFVIIIHTHTHTHTHTLFPLFPFPFPFPLSIQDAVTAVFQDCDYPSLSRNKNLENFKRRCELTSYRATYFLQHSRIPWALPCTHHATCMITTPYGTDMLPIPQVPTCVQYTGNEHSGSHSATLWCSFHCDWLICYGIRSIHIWVYICQSWFSVRYIKWIMFSFVCVVLFSNTWSR